MSTFYWALNTLQYYVQLEIFFVSKFFGDLFEQFLSFLSLPTDSAVNYSNPSWAY
jgi:hypothetical protein